MRPDRLGKGVSANLDVLRFPAPSDNTVGTPCLHCSWTLTLHLPDPQSPEAALRQFSCKCGTHYGDKVRREQPRPNAA